MRFVYKYGGSSLSSIEKIKAVAAHIKEEYDKDNQLTVVASAMGKTTNELISKANEITQNPDKRELDALMCTGEIVSVSLLSIALNAIGVPSVSLNAEQVGIHTNNDYTRAFIDHIDTQKLEKILAQNKVAVVAGFQGITENANFTTLGRGGSDTTAVALAAALKCDCNIYTDVDGVYTIDPRVYQNAKKLTTIPYSDMMELAVNGAKVLEPRSVELAAKYGINLYVGQSLEKEQKGTFVMNSKDYFERIILSGIAIKENVSLLTIKLSGNTKEKLHKIFNLIYTECVNLNMVSCQTVNDETILSFSCLDAQAKKIASDIISDAEFTGVIVLPTSTYTQICITGTGLSTHVSFISKILKVLCENQIDFTNISNSEISFAFLVNPQDKDKTIKLLAEKFDF